MRRDGLSPARQIKTVLGECKMLTSITTTFNYMDTFIFRKITITIRPKLNNAEVV